MKVGLVHLLEALALSLSSCGGGDPESVAIDFLADAERVLVERETTELRFGSAAAKRHYQEPDPRLFDEASGFKSLMAGDEPYAAAVGREAELTFFRLAPVAGAAPAPLRVRVEAAGPGDGQGSQRVAVLLNGEMVHGAEFELPAAKEPVAREFLLPSIRLVAGQNRLRFRFARTHEWLVEGEGVRYPLAGWFKKVSFTPINAGAREAEDLPRDLPDLVRGDGRGAPPAVILRQGSRLSVPFRVPGPGATLSLRLAVLPGESRDRTAEARVRLARDDGSVLLSIERTLTVESTPIAVEHDLAPLEGALVQLEVEAAAAPPGRLPVALALERPQVTVRALARDTAAVHAAAAPDAELASRRAALAGASVLLLVLDAAGARHFTPYGAAVENAKAVAKLAARGVTFERMSSPASYTLAAVGSLLTGLYPDTHGVVAGGSTAGAVRLADGTATLAERLGRSGYRTLALVTNPNAGAPYGYARGFGRYDALYDPKEGLWNEGVAAAELAPRLAAHLDAGALEPPFFLLVHVFQPHAPYRPPEPYLAELLDPLYEGPADGSRESIDAYKEHRATPYGDADFAAFRARHAANLRYADAAVQQVLELLEQRGLMERTVVVVASDHGEALGEHRSLEHGDTTYGEQVEVPFIVALPGASAPSRVAAPASLVDLAPTLLGLLSIDFDPSAYEGLDLSRAVLGAPVRVPERPLYLRSAGALPRFAVRHLGHSYHVDTFTREETLFDLGADPGELDSVAAERPVLREYSRLLLCRYLCSRQAAAESTEIPPHILTQLREIGYVEVAPFSGPSRCPLLRRTLE